MAAVQEVLKLGREKAVLDDQNAAGQPWHIQKGVAEKFTQRVRTASLSIVVGAGLDQLRKRFAIVGVDRVAQTTQRTTVALGRIAIVGPPAALGKPPSTAFDKAGPSGAAKASTANGCQSLTGQEKSPSSNPSDTRRSNIALTVAWLQALPSGPRVPVAEIAVMKSAFVVIEPISAFSRSTRRSAAESVATRWSSWSRGTDLGGAMVGRVIWWQSETPPWIRPRDQDDPWRRAIVRSASRNARAMKLRPESTRLDLGVDPGSVLNAHARDVSIEQSATGARSVGRLLG